jgi:hypothetical protein
VKAGAVVVSPSTPLLGERRSARRRLRAASSSGSVLLDPLSRAIRYLFDQQRCPRSVRRGAQRVCCATWASASIAGLACGLQVRPEVHQPIELKRKRRRRPDVARGRAPIWRA